MKPAEKEEERRDELPTTAPTRSLIPVDEGSNKTGITGAEGRFLIGRTKHHNFLSHYVSPREGRRRRPSPEGTGLLFNSTIRNGDDSCRRSISDGGWIASSGSLRKNRLNWDGGVVGRG